MRRTLLSVPLLVFCLSAPAQAAPLVISLFVEDVQITFGPNGVNLVLYTFFFCPGGRDCSAEAVGEIVIQAGPLISMTVTRDADGNPLSTLYEYPDASVAFEGTVFSDVIFFGDGAFTARVPMFHFTVQNEQRVGPFCDPYCGAFIEEELTFVDGLFNPDFAEVFGVRQPFESGSVSLFIDEITGTPDSPERTGQWLHNDGEIEAETVPEPGTTMLSLLAAAAFARRRQFAGRPATAACAHSPTVVK